MISNSQQIAYAVAWYVVTCVIDYVVVSFAAQPSLERDTITVINMFVTYRFLHICQLLGKSTD